MISLIEIKESNTLFDNHYQLIKKIGGGGFSEVWMAHDTVAEIDVALKIYTPNGDLDEEGKNDFKREFARLCDINHSNIIHAIGFGIYRDELPYLAMNICKNGSAKKLIGKIEEKELWNFIEQVASGLQYLHKHGIIHQDMKPDNVLINADGQYLIIDFGISTKTRRTLRKSVRGNIGGGTPWYMSIESFGKEASSIYARDIWAFGASLYEMATGDVPFGQYGGMTQKANGGKVPEIKQDFSSELKQLIYDCLALNAWDRPDADKILQRVANHKANIKPAGRKTTSTKYSISTLVLLATACCIGWYYYIAPSKPTDQSAVTENKNDSILFASVERANMIVNEERIKSDVSSRSEERLCSAANIYKTAVEELEVSESAKEKGRQMWHESQTVINETYRHLYSTGARYSQKDAENAAKDIWKRSQKLRGYVSATVREKVEHQYEYKDNYKSNPNYKKTKSRTLKRNVSTTEREKVDISNQEVEHKISNQTTKP